MKKKLIIFLSVVVLGYLIASMIYFNKSSKDIICNSVEIVIKDSLTTNFVHPEDIRATLKKEKAWPVDSLMSNLNLMDIHHAILSNKLVKSAKVYKKGDKIYANIYQREPVLRVYTNSGEAFYVDRDREVLPVSINFAVHVPVATGIVDEEFAQNELYDFVSYLKRSSAWDVWIDQIVVKSNRDVVLIPKAGDFKIVFGQLDQFNEKFSRLELFFEKGLDVVGWNRYKEINLKFDNQIVCTRK